MEIVSAGKTPEDRVYLEFFEQALTDTIAMSAAAVLPGEKLDIAVSGVGETNNRALQLSVALRDRRETLTVPIHEEEGEFILLAVPPAEAAFAAFKELERRGFVRGASSKVIRSKLNHFCSQGLPDVAAGTGLSGVSEVLLLPASAGAMALPLLKKGIRVVEPMDEDRWAVMDLRMQRLGASPVRPTLSAAPAFVSFWEASGEDGAKSCIYAAGKYAFYRRACILVSEQSDAPDLTVDVSYHQVVVATDWWSKTTAARVTVTLLSSRGEVLRRATASFARRHAYFDIGSSTVACGAQPTRDSAAGHSLELALEKMI